MIGNSQEIPNGIAVAGCKIAIETRRKYNV
jgi:hypothetical protein